ncbi:sulfite exporter TauE/SafE family protein [Pararhizobium mangrovi]|uniref:Probable membrane transporter protein n=1 Tax=Pararhizobium mangrovi TaxID=2590452 RepID=A0A506U556_9HYPH|nr:sulfite exporter TauE/SafE family protein [Pararhizobium mangrovi]TPW28990.1 sulfite exporter TauE/SafE family protein [Pararhizobium mangrovi]
MEYVALYLAAGFIGGIVNSAAGGAKLFVFPLLLASGMPPVAANATGTVALWPAQLPVVWSYRRELAAYAASFRIQLPLAVLGALVGSCALIVSSEGTFLAVIPVLLCIAVGAILAGKQLSVLLQRLFRRETLQTASIGLLFLTGIYGGYFGAGMGFILLAIFSIASSRDLHHANASKNLFATCINTTAVIPLAFSGLVHWFAALSVLVGGLAGGAVSGWLLRRIPETPLRWAVTTLGVVLTASFLMR